MVASGWRQRADEVVWGRVADEHKDRERAAAPKNIGQNAVEIEKRRKRKTPKIYRKNAHYVRVHRVRARQLSVSVCVCVWGVGVRYKQTAKYTKTKWSKKKKQKKSVKKMQHVLWAVGGVGVGAWV